MGASEKLQNCCPSLRMASHSMPVRKLGVVSGSALGFGCMSLTPGFLGGGQDPAVSEKVLRKALDSGITVLNTADFYTGWDEGDEVSGNIRLIGKVIADYPRKSVVISMKFGVWVEPGKGFGPVDLSPETCKNRVADALKVMGLDYIDILILRLGMGTDLNNTPIEETAKAMKELVEEGKARAIGVSEAPMEDAKKIHSVVPVSAIELRWNLCSREAEKEVIPWARSVGAGIIAYSPLGAGVLTGKLDLEGLHPQDMRLRHPLFKASLDKNQKLAHEVEKLAAKKVRLPDQ